MNVSQKNFEPFHIVSTILGLDDETVNPLSDQVIAPAMAPITINREIGVIKPNEDQEGGDEDDTDDQISFVTVEELSENGQIDDWILGHSPSGVSQEADLDRYSEAEPMEEPWFGSGTNLNRTMVIKRQYHLYILLHHQP